MLLIQTKMSKSKEVWDDASSSTQKRNYNQIYNGNGQNYKTKLHIHKSTPLLLTKIVTIQFELNVTLEYKYKGFAVESQYILIYLMTNRPVTLFRENPY
jgi:hypothetical protein